MGLKYRCVPILQYHVQRAKVFWQVRSGVKSLISSALYAIRDAARAAVDNQSTTPPGVFQKKIRPSAEADPRDSAAKTAAAGCGKAGWAGQTSEGDCQR